MSFCSYGKFWGGWTHPVSLPGGGRCYSSTTHSQLPPATSHLVQRWAQDSTKQPHVSTWRSRTFVLFIRYIWICCLNFLCCFISSFVCSTQSVLSLILSVTKESVCVFYCTWRPWTKSPLCSLFFAFSRNWNHARFAYFIISVPHYIFILDFNGGLCVSEDTNQCLPAMAAFVQLYQYPARVVSRAVDSFKWGCHFVFLLCSPKWEGCKWRGRLGKK